MSSIQIPNIFPHPLSADAHGVLAFGGDLHVDRLKLAYQFGIFPWYNEGEPIIWWAPRKRFVIYPDQVKVSKSMRSYFNQNRFRVTTDRAFEKVIRACKTTKRGGQEGTWITDKLEQSFIQLHGLGYAHSVEVWEKEELIGGLYGMSLGKCFYGESMFSLKSNASKFGFISLCNVLKEKSFWLIDCQIENPHLKSLGGVDMSNESFHELMLRNLFEPTTTEKWDLF